MATTNLDTLYGYKPIRPFSPAHGQIYMAPNVPQNPRDGEIYFNEDTENTYRYDAKLKIWAVLTPNTQLDKIRRLAGIPLPGEEVKEVKKVKEKKYVPVPKKRYSDTVITKLKEEKTQKEPLLTRLKAKMPKIEVSIPARLGVLIQEIM